MFGGIWSKGCKKCRGDLLLERGEDDLYVACLQCSTVDRELTKLVQMRYGTKMVRASHGGNLGSEWATRQTTHSTL